MPVRKVDFIRTPRDAGSNGMHRRLNGDPFPLFLNADHREKFGDVSVFSRWNS